MSLSHFFQYNTNISNCNKLVGHTWEDPLVYMVSPMASTCDPYATKMHKSGAENFAGQKRTKMAKRTRFSPKKAKPDAFWVLEGGAAGADGWENRHR